MGCVSSWRKPCCPGRCDQLSLFAIVGEGGNLIVIVVDYFCLSLSRNSLFRGWCGGAGVVIVYCRAVYPRRSACYCPIYQLGKLRILVLMLLVQSAPDGQCRTRT